VRGQIHLDDTKQQPAFRSLTAMSTLILLDPALSLNDFNHHTSSYRELRAASRELGIECTVLASTWNQPADCRDVVPFFESDTYYFFTDLADYQHRQGDIRNRVARDYARLDISSRPRLLLQSASPWQLEGLAAALRGVAGVRLAIGMIFPSQFWTRDAALQSLLDHMTWQALESLDHLNPFIFSETGFALNQGHAIPLATRVSMMSDATLQLCRDLADTDDEIPGNPVTFGFFGGMFDHKGVSLILNASRHANLDRNTHRIRFVVPPEHHDRTAEITSVSDCIDFAAAPLQTDEYLKEMHSVTAILCCYDQRFYAHQMSGIVTEAAALGKPVVVSRQTSLHRFLLQYAPGAAVPVDQDPIALAAILNRPVEYWRAKQREASLTTPLVRELKSFNRFLQLALGY
jgi:hypothetical protein